MKRVIMFSGQGSQAEGMGVSLAGNSAKAKEVFDTASQILGFDLLDKCANAPAEELAKTVIAQPAIMAVSLAGACALLEKGIEATAAVGHSLGEYAALVYTGIVSLEDGFRLIKARSEAMQKAADSSDGVMYAIIGKTTEEIEAVCEKTEGYVLPVNYNSAVQTVIAGEAEPAKAAADALAEAGARAIKLNVASAFHSKLMQPAADEFLQFAKTVTYNAPKITMLSNITGAPITDCENAAERLAAHIVSPVRFTDEIYWLEKNGFEQFIECGPGKTLTGLVRKTVKNVALANIQTFDDVQALS